MNLALLGNGSFQALVDDKASVQWLCWPRFDSSFCFGALVDPDKGGEFSVVPELANHEVRQRYLPRTAIVETVFSRPGEVFCVTDFAPRSRNGDSVARPRRLVRRLRAIEGRPRLSFRCRPVYDYGRGELQRQVTGGSTCWETRAGCLHLQSSAGVSEAETFCLEGDVYLVLSWGSTLEGELDQVCRDLLADTTHYWRRWVDSLRLPVSYRDEVIRSAITLKLHQYGDTGAITAAATTSIPEHAGSGRNWDYRYCWPRDSYMTADALAQLGSPQERSSLVDFFSTLAESAPGFQPLYGIGGERRIEEQVLDHLAGYRGDGPVRIGNQAYEQEQHDIYGEMIATVAPVHQANPSPKTRQLVMRLLEEIERNMDRPGAGIWEKRNRPVVHTFSLLMHWLGGRTAHELGLATGDELLATRGAAVMAGAGESIEEHCWREEQGFYADSPSGDHADASLLLMATMGYLAPTDPRAQSHMRIIRDRLQDPVGLLHRYLYDDGLGPTESSFVVCTLWYAEALACVGERDEAERTLRSVLAHSNHLGLLSEDVDPRDDSLWGNFPQTYSHVGIIRCAIALDREA